MTLENAFGPLALNATVVSGNALLTSILAAVDQLEGYTDGIEALLATGNGGNATLTSILAAVDQLEGYTDGLEALIGTTNATLTTIDGRVDGLEALQAAANALLTTIRDNADQLEGFTDGIETLLTSGNALSATGNASLVSILAAVDQLEGYVDTLEALIAATNTKLDAANVTLTAVNDALHPTGTNPGGMSAYRNISVLNVGQSIKGSAGKVYSIHAACNTASDRFLKLYNVAGVPTAADVPVLTIPLYLADGTVNLTFEGGLAFPLGIGIRATTGIADADNVAPTANSVVVNIGFR